MSDAVIRFEAVTKRFGERTVLDRVSFAVQRGEIFFVLGRSGVGKSVTLKHLVGLLKPDSGEIWVGDQSVATLGEVALEAIRRRCGMVFQQPALLDSLDVAGNVAFGLRNLSRDPELLHAHVVKTLGEVGLEASFAPRRVQDLSYGAQKRVAIARTLAPGPEILLFDEPTTGLDPVSTQIITDLIQSLSRRLQTTSVVVSHDMVSALRTADRILVLEQGRVLALGTPAEIERSAEPLIKSFLEEVRA